jgi:hypothetical protein
MRSFDKLRISARGSDAAPSPQLRLRRAPLSLARTPLSMTTIWKGGSLNALEAWRLWHSKHRLQQTSSEIRLKMF